MCVCNNRAGPLFASVFCFSESNLAGDKGMGMDKGQDKGRTEQDRGGGALAVHVRPLFTNVRAEAALCYSVLCTQALAPPLSACVSPGPSRREAV